MKKNKIKLACAVLAVLILYTSCEFFTRTNENETKDTEPTYTPDVAWTLETKCVWPAGSENQYGQYLYIIESRYRYSPEQDEFNIAKIDLKTGKYVWQSSTIVKGVETSSVIKSNDNLFIQVKNLLYCFSDADGTLSATIEFSNKTDAGWGQILADEHYLYWGTGYKTDALMRFDTKKIDFDQAPTTAQLIPPESMWSGEGGIGALPIIDNGIMYVLTHNDRYSFDEGTSTLIAIDIDTKVVKWTKDFTFSEDGYPISGKTLQPLYIEGNNLYVIDYAIGCYNKNNGETVHEVRQTSKDFMHEVYLGASFLAPSITYSDGKFYYGTLNHSKTAADMGFPEEYNKNIICIDATNGKYLWGDMPPGGGSFRSTPLVINGKSYVMTDTGLRVYNAKTGKLLGVDKSVGTLGEDRPSQYEDKFIYFDVDYADGIGLLTAIHAR